MSTTVSRIACGACAELAPREAIGAFLAEILKRSLADREHKGCLLENAAVEMAPHDPEFQETIADVLIRIERFLMKCVKAGQTDGTISRSLPAEQLAKLLGVLVGIRVLACGRSGRWWKASLRRPSPCWNSLIDREPAVRAAAERRNLRCGLKC